MTSEADTEARATDAGTPASSGSGIRTRVARLDHRFPRGRVMLLLAIAVLLVDGLTIGKLQFVSVVDEGAYIDHVIRGSRLELVQIGDGLDSESERELCVRKSEVVQYKHCRGQNANKVRNWAGHTPFYFWLTGPPARALRALPIDLPPNDSMITWARLLQSLWLLLGLYLTLRAGELMGVARRPLAFALLLIAFIPVVLHASTIVNPDITALPAGAAVLLAALHWERRQRLRQLVWLAVISGAAVLLDETNGVAVILAATYLAIMLLKEARPDERWRDRLRPVLTVSVAMLGAGVVARYGWDIVEAGLIEIIGPNGVDLSKNPALAYTVHGNPSILTFFGTDRIFGLFPPVLDPTPPLVRTEELYAGFGLGASLLVAGSIVGRTLWSKLSDRMDALATATLVTLLVGGPLTAIYFYVTARVATAPTERFGLSALPAAAIVLAATTRGRFAQGLVAFVAVGLGVSAVLVLF